MVGLNGHKMPDLSSQAQNHFALTSGIAQPSEKTKVFKEGKNEKKCKNNYHTYILSIVVGVFILRMRCVGNCAQAYADACCLSRTDLYDRRY